MITRRLPHRAQLLVRHRLARQNRLRAPFPAAVAGLAGMGMLAGCGGDPAGYNDADVTYAADVTSHHAQTLQVLDLSLGRQTLDPELGVLADETRKQLFAEVDVTQKWLKINDQPVPKTALEHSHAEQQPYDTSIAGMLSADQMHQLEKATDREFQAAWLDALITHEKGAVDLAQTAVDDAQNADLLQAAEADLQHHQTQLSKLEDLAGS